jgi:hypothetical protein
VLVLLLGAGARARVRRGGSCEAWDGREEGKTHSKRSPQSSSARKSCEPWPRSEFRMPNFIDVRSSASLWKPRRTAPSTSAVGDVIVLCGKHGPAVPCRRPVPSAFSFPCVPETRKYHSPMVADGILLPVQQFESIRRRIPSSRGSGFWLGISGCIYATRQSLIPETPHVRRRRRRESLGRRASSTFTWRMDDACIVVIDQPY